MIYVVVSDRVLPETRVLGFECDTGLEVKLNKASTIYFLSDFLAHFADMSKWFKHSIATL